MGLFNDDKGFEEALALAKKNRDLYETLDLPSYSQMIPELMNYESANYQLAQDDPVSKSMQLEALARMKGLSEEGLSGVDDAAFFRARQMGDQMAKAKTDAAIQNAQMRGVAGGGQEFAMREQAAQEAAQRAQEAGLARAQAAAQQRAQYLNAYANQAAGARDQDYRTNAGNADVINRFNMANTQGRNQANQANVNAKNNAFMYNEGLKDKNYNNQLGRVDRLTGMNNKEGEIRAAEQDADRKRRQAVAGMVGAGIGSMGGPNGAAVGGQIGSSLY